MPSLPQPLAKFYADRGPHLAAMIAYFALLSFVPLLFLTISALALAGRPDESSYLVTELKRAFPGSSISSIVHTVREIQKHATALGIIGGAALLWTSLRSSACSSPRSTSSTASRTGRSCAGSCSRLG